MCTLKQQKRNKNTPLEKFVNKIVSFSICLRLVLLCVLVNSRRAMGVQTFENSEILEWREKKTVTSIPRKIRKSRGRHINIEISNKNNKLKNLSIRKREE